MLTPKTVRQETILIADADTISREMYTQFLRHHGFQVVPVSTRRAAVAAAPAADAIITEMRLPTDTDGLALVRELKSDIRTSAVPLIVVTSCAWLTDRERAQAAGCDLYLSKPCLPHDLMQAARRLMARRRLAERTTRNLRHVRRPNRPARTWRRSRRIRSILSDGEAERAQP
jgi:two-component system OmpR family response regulator